MKQRLAISLFCSLFIAMPAMAQDTTPSTPDEPSTPTEPAAPAEPSTPEAPAEESAAQQEATKAYNAGITALNANNYDEAAVQFGKAVELDPNDASAQMLLGYVLLKQEKWQEALAPLEAARRLEARLDENARPIVANNLGTALGNLDRPVDAIQAYQRALQLNPNYHDARYNLGFALLSQRRFDEALPHFTTLQKVAQYENDPAVLDALGEIYENQNNWGLAMGFYKRAMEATPRDAQAKFKLAWGLVRTNRPDDALPYLQQAVALDPSHAPSYLLLGDLHIRKRNWSEAQKVLERYVELAPEDFTGQFNLGVAYDYDSKFEQALAAYAKAEKLRPQDAAVRNNIGRIYFKQGKQPEAIAKLREALELEPNFTDARVNLALSLATDTEEAAQLQQANQEWETLLAAAQTELKEATTDAARVEINNRIAMYHGARAENFLKLKRYPEAAETYEQFLKINPGNEDAMINRALAFYHMKNFFGAAELLREVIKRNEKNATAHNNLGVILESLNRPGEALESYRRAAQLRPGYTEAEANVKRLSPPAP